MNILIVDDELTLTDMITVVIKNAGHVPEAVNDGDKALEKIRERPGFYDLLIVDHKMPRMSGTELVQLLRAEHYPGRIIILSGNLHQAKEAYKKMKVDMIIHKPFDLYEIEEAISSFAARMKK